MATSDTQSAPRADLHSGAAAWPDPAPQPDAGFAAGRRIPGTGWVIPAVCLTVVLTGVGFLIICLGMFVLENAVVWVAGLIVMDLGIVGWTLVACYLLVAYIRYYLASRRKSGRLPIP